MKIAYIAAGAANMYCGSCIHDNTLAAALIKKGHEVALIPTYTPLRTDEDNVTLDQVFYGGINVYLEQKFSLFRHTPWLVDKLFNSRLLLNWASRFSATTNAKDLGSLTVSVLQGEEGRQKKELAKLIKWLQASFRPEIVQLTNSMFLGMAKEIKKALGVPVLCAVQGEDLFINDLVEPYRSQARQLMRARAQDVDGFIATSQYYADFMADFLQVPIEKMHVVRLGINLQGHGVQQNLNGTTKFVIGYLARICPEKGLHLLIEAFQQLAQKLGKNALALEVAGYLGARDRRYFENFVKQIDAWGLSEAFHYHGEVTRHEKINFLNRLHVLSVPTTYKEPKGLSILEALANGVPVVQPKHGTFPELLLSTGGGILVEPNSPQALAEGIETLLHNAELREQLGQSGKSAAQRLFSDEVMAGATVEVYQKYLARGDAFRHSRFVATVSP
ncbi:MAG: glycosyltransferase family 4 protein [candidate division KSB1 bacterium]|nr:glycosyltransferase family 4 protein [candidate division KSB1 bacterium]MDZ7366845.1 glycosyltransferase family 4 protein [candidate division KSB1 bacterium]MDZ7405148.1 glycosyltransferase family 4 protein [candidate division KSB1 bacterium]